MRAQLKPGDEVCDLGCGSGILGFLALQAGAAHVHAIEQSRVIETARALAAANRLERITFHHAPARDVALPRAVDWIVLEWMSPLGLDEFPLADFLDARTRFLSPQGGRCIPRVVDHNLTLVEDADAWSQLAAPWHQPYYGLNLDSVLPVALERTEELRVCADGFLAEPTVWQTIDLEGGLSFPSHGRFGAQRVRVPIVRDGTCHGIAAWFDADLGGGVRLSNHPGAPETHWPTVFAPLPAPTPVREGDEAVVDLARVRSPGRDDLVWSLELLREGHPVGSFRNSCPGSAVVQVEDAMLQTGRFAPQLTPEHSRILAFLSRVDGRTGARAIARQLAAAEPDLFPNFESALRWIVDGLGRTYAIEQERQGEPSVINYRGVSKRRDAG